MSASMGTWSYKGFEESGTVDNEQVNYLLMTLCFKLADLSLCEQGQGY